jgi:DNA-binding response OmpR family regulator
MRAEPPRLALIDWDLPDVEGPELCRLLRDFHLGRPPYVILLTPAVEGRDITAGLIAGASDFVFTPVTGSELRARVEYGRTVVELPWGRQASEGLRAEAIDEEYDAGGPVELMAMTSDQWTSALEA